MVIHPSIVVYGHLWSSMVGLLRMYVVSIVEQWSTQEVRGPLRIYGADLLCWFPLWMRGGSVVDLWWVNF